MKPMMLFVCIIALLAITFAGAGQEAPRTLLPETCSSGWIPDGRAKVYTPQNLYEYIDGEAELYLSYGFKHLVTAFYRKAGAKSTGLVVNVYRMGSLLDAFGIYSNYRSPSNEPLQVGAEGFADDSQLMYYQDRYFVQIMGSGSPVPDRSAFVSCAAAISKRLPPGAGKPLELQFLAVPGLVRGSEKYYPEGLLGQKFLGRGLTAEVTSREQPLRAVVVIADSHKALEHALAEYKNYLTKSGTTPTLTRERSGSVLHGIDPLYKGINFKQSGRYAVGVTGLSNSNEGQAAVDQLIKRSPKE